MSSKTVCVRWRKTSTFDCERCMNVELGTTAWSVILILDQWIFISTQETPDSLTWSLGPLELTGVIRQIWDWKFCYRGLFPTVIPSIQVTKCSTTLSISFGCVTAINRSGRSTVHRVCDQRAILNRHDEERNMKAGSSQSINWQIQPKQPWAQFNWRGSVSSDAAWVWQNRDVIRDSLDQWCYYTIKLNIWGFI